MRLDSKGIGLSVRKTNLVILNVAFRIKPPLPKVIGQVDGFGACARLASQELRNFTLAHLTNDYNMAGYFE